MGKLAQHLHLGVRGSVHIELERLTLLPGERVLGNVHLRVLKHIERAELRVRVRGDQRLRWAKQTGETRTTHSISLHHLETTIILQPQGSAFGEGDVNYPFTFQLPASLPPSLSYHSKGVGSLEDVRIEIPYAVEATLTADSFTTANITSATAFVVERPPLVHPIPVPKPVGAPQSKDIKLLGMLRRGTCRASLRLPSDVLDAAAVIEAKVTIHLETSRKLQYVLLALYEDATVNRQQGRRLKHGSRIAGCRRFDAATLGSAQPLELTLQLPVTPNNVYQFDALLPVGIECHFGLASELRVVVPVTVVPALPVAVAVAPTAT